MRNTQRDALEQCSGLLPTTKWDYPEWDVFMWFAFLFKPYKKIPQTIQYATVDFRVQRANPFCTGALDAACPRQRDVKGLHFV